jgi:hypothetical protein
MATRVPKNFSDLHDAPVSTPGGALRYDDAGRLTAARTPMPGVWPFVDPPPVDQRVTADEFLATGRGYYLWWPLASAAPAANPLALQGVRGQLVLVTRTGSVQTYDGQPVTLQGARAMLMFTGRAGSLTTATVVDPVTLQGVRSQLALTGRVGSVVTYSSGGTGPLVPGNPGFESALGTTVLRDLGPFWSTQADNYPSLDGLANWEAVLTPGMDAGHSAVTLFSPGITGQSARLFASDWLDTDLVPNQTYTSIVQRFTRAQVDATAGTVTFDLTLEQFAAGSSVKVGYDVYSGVSPRPTVGFAAIDAIGSHTVGQTFTVTVTPKDSINYSAGKSWADVAFVDLVVCAISPGTADGAGVKIVVDNFR